jgi:hypothetical protein
MDTRQPISLLGPLGLAFGLALVASRAPAAVLTFDYTFAYSGSDPSGTPPWLRATFTDGSSANEVSLRLEGLDLPRGEFVTSWLFNLDPRLDAERLVVEPTGGLAPARIRAGENDFNRGGARFDLLVAFPTRHGPGRFTDGDVSELRISWSGDDPLFPLTAASFAFDSAGSRAIEASAHVQGIGWCDASGWVGANGALEPPDEPVPEPGTLLLVGSGLLGLGRTRRRQRG